MRKITSSCCLNLLVIWAIGVAFVGRKIKVERNWWKGDENWPDYTKRPDYIRYQKARKIIAKFPKLENWLLGIKVI